MQTNNPPSLDGLDLTAVSRAASGELLETTPDQLMAAKDIVKEESHDQSRKRLENNDLAQNIQLRKLFGCLTFALVALWMAASMTLIYLIAFNLARLTDAVLIALITTTLATVVGLLWLVLAYLFPQIK